MLYSINYKYSYIMLYSINYKYSYIMLYSINYKYSYIFPAQMCFNEPVFFYIM